MEKYELIIEGRVADFLATLWGIGIEISAISGGIFGFLLFILQGKFRSRLAIELWVILSVQPVIPLMFFVQSQIPRRFLDTKYHIDWDLIVYWLGGALGAFSLALLMLAFWSLIWSKIKRIVTWRSNRYEQKDNDIVELFKKKKKRKSVNFFKRIAEGYFYWGETEDGGAVYKREGLVKESNILTIGATGSGKSMFLSLIIAQALGLSRRSLRFYFLRFLGFGSNIREPASTCVVIDPKRDKNLPRVLLKLSKTVGFPIQVIDLNDTRAAACILEGTTYQERIEFNQSEPGFTDRNLPSDFHNIPEHDEIEKFSRFYDTRLSLLANWSRYKKENRNLKSRAPTFYSHMKNLTRLGVFNAAPGEGFRLEESMEKGGVIYVYGNIRRLEVKKLMRLFQLRLMQYVESRRCENPKHVLFVLDEFRYVLNRNSLTALQTIRDKSANCLLATQDIEDVTDNDLHLPPESIRSAVLTNTRFKIAFETPNATSAEYLSKLSGETTRVVASENLCVNQGLVELMTDDRTIKIESAPLFHTNEFLALQPGEAISFGAGLAQRIFVSPIYYLSESDPFPEQTIYKSMKNEGMEVHIKDDEELI